ncbi:ATP-binding protein [Clavibacter sp. Sh2141]|uniref:ATP-binding protein n=1 Tax=Clavibacter sp. Sh2141 TaxID=3395374 RepID=UPI0039BD1C8D
MYDATATRIGTVRKVLGSEVTVELDESIAGVAPIFEGKVMSIGQIGSLVRIPQGMVDLIATVTLVGIAELKASGGAMDGYDPGSRWLQVQLLGQIDRGTGQFDRGVGSYPGLDDSVHFAISAELTSVFPEAGEEHLSIGTLSAASDVTVALKLEKLVMRHSAVVGSTGSGKTSAVTSILQRIVNGGWASANVIVIDTHGEYSHGLGSTASVRSVLDDGESKLVIPYWALPAADILRAFTGSSAGGGTVKRFATLVTEARRQYVNSTQWLTIDEAAVTADTPVPFDIKQVWFALDSENQETRDAAADPASVQIVQPGDAATLTPSQFTPYAPGSKKPSQGPFYDAHGNVPELLRLGLTDPRLRFLLGNDLSFDGPDPLQRAMEEWLGHEKAISVLNFNGVPSEAAELAIGVVLKLLFETSIRTPAGGEGIGRPRPLLLVLEEAHRYVGEAATPMARKAVNTIAREGRKYGVGLMLVTQRPSELPDTALAQCGTIIALRLTNGADQSKIRQALPDNVSGLAETLPSLRTGEAIISGEAMLLPSRARLYLPDPMPLAEDPSVKSWRDTPTVPNVAPALAIWRGIYEGGKHA